MSGGGLGVRDGGSARGEAAVREGEKRSFAAVERQDGRTPSMGRRRGTDVDEGLGVCLRAA
jgi:hypothetical protein